MKSYFVSSSANFAILFNSFGFETYDAKIMLRGIEHVRKNSEWDNDSSQEPKSPIKVVIVANKDEVGWLNDHLIE